MKRKIQGRFCEKQIAPKSVFDKRSFRWKQSGSSWVLVGCKKGQFAKGRCKVGLKAFTILVQRKGKSCSVGSKRITK